VDVEHLKTTWIVSAPVAKALIEQGATVWDARGGLLPFKKTIPGAIAVNWQYCCPSQSPHQGNLLSDAAVLTQKLRQLGVMDDTPIVVFGDPLKGWGEEGRLVWMLRSLGHPAAVWVDGGYAALGQTGLPTSWSFNQTIPAGDFTVHRTPRWEIQQDELKARLDDPKLVLIDTREQREFQGATPYGEQRGGHLPGAIHLYFRELLDAQGNLLPRRTILERLQAFGIDLETAELISYCTGGVRSGWMTTVFADLELTAKNYAGSTWEWSAAPAEEYPLCE
jgi:thiosulfate/3-mercaptopyruvate sulfurtransferase